MAYIEITNDSNHVLIDDTFQNYVYAAGGDYPFMLRTGNYWNLNKEPFVYKGHAESEPFIAVVAAVNMGYIPIPFNVTKDGNVFKFMFSGKNINESVKTGRVLVFDRPNPVVPPTGLVVVRDAQGRVTFDSSRKYMRVIGNMTADSKFAAREKIAVAYASVTMGYSRVIAGSMVGYQFASTFVVSGSKGDLSTVHKYFDSSLGRSYTTPPAGWPMSRLLGKLSALILDVSHII